MTGFTPADYAVALVCLLCVALWRARPAWAPRSHQVAAIVLFLLPIALRVALLPNYPVPTPSVADDFSYWLAGDTLRHFRLANPVHPMHAFFETFFVLQEPSFASIFPIGQGVALAAGGILGHPWIGVLVTSGLLAAGCYWMLLAWTSREWAFAGGLLTAIQFGPLSQWMNSYWGGFVSALAGCLIFGAIPRLRARSSVSDAALLGAGLAIQLLTRPFECALLLIPVALYLRASKRDLAVISAIAALGLAVMALHNRSVTGSWTRLPYQESQRQYGVPAAFSFQSTPEPQRELTPQQRLNFEVQSLGHDDPHFARLAFRVRYYRFFFLVPLYLAMPFFFPALRELRFQWVTLVLVVLALGTNFYTYFYPHYIAAATCLFVLMSVVGLERLAQFRPQAARWLLVACGVHFLFWYGLHLAPHHPFSRALIEFETWDAINSGDPEGRIAINRRLAAAEGEQLVFVRYSTWHRFEEWVHNAADIDSARVVWARDRGARENTKLLAYYPRRTAWLLEPDARPPRLTAYAAAAIAAPRTDRETPAR